MEWAKAWKMAAKTWRRRWKSQKGVTDVLLEAVKRRAGAQAQVTELEAHIDRKNAVIDELQERVKELEGQLSLSRGEDRYK